MYVLFIKPSPKHLWIQLVANYSTDESECGSDWWHGQPLGHETSLGWHQEEWHQDNVGLSANLHVDQLYFWHCHFSKKPLVCEIIAKQRKKTTDLHVPCSIPWFIFRQIFSSPRILWTNHSKFIKSGKSDTQLISYSHTFLRNRIYEHLSEINLSEIIEDGKSAIKYLSNTSKIAETAEKVIGNAFVQQLEDKNVK